ncbi:MAG TPA: PHB depolymerase family esterase [Gaiellaceae bacterium]|nr:PHB depolymerase family esterase [Gaiellaceae bacterium]
MSGRTARWSRATSIPARLLVVSLVVLVAAVWSTATVDARIAPRVTTSGAAGAACEEIAGSPPKTSTLTLTVSGRRRIAVVHLPSGYTGLNKIPLVLNMHGTASTAAEQEQFTAMDKTADEHDFLVVYPQAVIASGTGFAWNVPDEPLLDGDAVPKNAANDVAFLVSLVQTLKKRYCIDAKRVYATGFSGGARMASQLGCALPKTIAAVAPVSGLRYPAACRGTRPVPVVSMHGTADPVDPYDGDGAAYWTYGVPTAARRWAVHNRCAAKAAVSSPTGGVELTAYGRCKRGASVELYTIAGEGHTWPDGPSLPAALLRVLGPQSNALDANEVIWRFFAAHPLR